MDQTQQSGSQPIEETLESQQGNQPSESKAKRFPVIELFGPVIQGEGSQAGQQTMFIRFGGCDYRCKQCDSLHAVIPQAVQKNATYQTAQEIFEALEKARDATGVEWVTFSGGNPLMHKLDELVDLMITAGYSINVETQGTLWQDWLYNVSVVTVSPKSWGMGEKFEEAKYVRFLERLNGVRPTCIKVVVFSEQDLEFALGIEQITRAACKNWLYGGEQALAFYLSLGNPYPPVMDDEFNMHDHTPIGGLVSNLLSSYRRLSEEVLLDPRLKSWRFLPQLHVLVYGNEAGR
jgi:7-carboxy-7-deazaguanine synthase